MSDIPANEIATGFDALVRRRCVSSLASFAPIAVIGAVLVVAFLLIKTSNVSTIRVGAETQLTEKVAVKASREALQANGYDESRLKPVMFDSQHYFARNIYDSNTGYVLWRSTEDRDIGYTVYLNRKEDVVDCKIVRNNK